MRKILLTGGAGYIGSHVCVELIRAGWAPVIIDNLCNSNSMVVHSIERITGYRPELIVADVRDELALELAFFDSEIEAVIHLAGLKAVDESVANPLLYYENNVLGTVSLLRAMERAQVSKLVFSSSATVYNARQLMPVHEGSELKPSNPYGRTKLIIEDMLRDLGNGFQTVLLRYFNPIGADESGLIGEQPLSEPKNLAPSITRAAAGLKRLCVYGDDWPTDDGFAVRDFIHVTDLALGHIAALDCLDDLDTCEAFNLGTGEGVSVLELIEEFEEVVGRKIPYDVITRRPGDIPICFADVTKARETLGWAAERDLHTACADAWRWQQAR